MGASCWPDENAFVEKNLGHTNISLHIRMSVHTYEWILAPLSLVIRGEGLGGEGFDASKGLGAEGVGNATIYWALDMCIPSPPDPLSPKTERGGEQFFLLRPSLDFHHFHQASLTLRVGTVGR